MISTGEAVIRLLADYGVDTLFGIPGVHTLDFYRGLGDDAKLRHIHARNEMGAGFMADGYARSCGKPGVCLTISGPGVTNAATPLGQSYADSIPLLLISAEAHSDTLGKGHGTLHEVSDLNAVTRPLCAFSECAKKPEDIPPLLAKAFDLFASKRPRPVHISIPIDVLEMHIEYDWEAETPSCLPIASSPDLEAIAELLASTENPFILIGGGAVGSDIQTLAETIGAITLSSNAGKGIMPDAHELSLGGAICRPEAQALLKDADAILAIGTELSETDNYIGKLAFNCPLIRIDIDETRFEDLYDNTHPILADAADTVSRLNTLLEAKLPNPDEKATRLAKRIEEVSQTRAEISSNLMAFEKKHIKTLAALRKTLPQDALIMGDATQMSYSASFGLEVNRERCWHYAAGYCALGFAFPNAIGAKLAYPERDVIAIAGDGGTMFTVQELITAAELKLPIPLILWHNNGYQQIRDDMRANNVPRVAVDGLAPDFEMLAKSMHCHSVSPTSMSDFRSQVQDALTSDRPTIIIIHEDSDWLS